MILRPILTRKATMSLVMLISILMSLLVAWGVYSGIRNMYGGSEDDRSYVIDNINKQLEKITTEGESSSEYTTYINPDEFIMFFSYSETNEPIRYVFESDTIPGETYYRTFERPDYAPECEKSACICRCDQGPYWKYAKDGNGVETVSFEGYSIPVIKDPINSLAFKDNKEAEGYICSLMECVAVKPEETVFYNSRGYEGGQKFIKKDSSSSLDIYKKIFSDGEVVHDPTNLTYIPFVTMYIPSLVEDAKKEIEEVRPQLGRFYKFISVFNNNYTWQGGVVFGGHTPFVGPKKNGFNQPAPVRVSMNFQTPLDEDHFTHYTPVAVCHQKDQKSELCTSKDAEKDIKQQERKVILENDLRFYTESYKNYLEDDFRKCIAEATVRNDYETCYGELGARTSKFYELDTILKIGAINQFQEQLFNHLKYIVLIEQQEDVANISLIISHIENLDDYMSIDGMSTFERKTGLDDVDKNLCDGSLAVSGECSQLFEVTVPGKILSTKKDNVVAITGRETTSRYEYHFELANGDEDDKYEITTIKIGSGTDSNFVMNFTKKSTPNDE
ncbi:MAG: hypothetical protein ACOCU6_00165 [Nanoarchaeota archaeon]